MRDAVTEIAIENPIARDAFIRWWRTMEAQGYQYGFEALCNVWVGFDDGRSDLARKILKAVEAEEVSRFGAGAHGISGAIRELLEREGVALPPVAA